jgi:hypothetical protein
LIKGQKLQKGFSAFFLVKIDSSMGVLETGMKNFSQKTG